MSNASIESIQRRLERLTALQIDEIERHVTEMEMLNGKPKLVNPDLKVPWPHAPVHELSECGVYMVTGSTLNKNHIFRTAESLDLLQSTLLKLASDYQWQLEAWSCFSNHYHLIARADKALCSLDKLLNCLHSQTGATVNALENIKGRTVWYNYFDTKLTYQKSYLARLNYVHQNPVRHGLVKVANQYPWCSAAWFERTATPAQIKTVYSFKTDRVRVHDDFDTYVDLVK